MRRAAGSCLWQALRARQHKHTGNARHFLRYVVGSPKVFPLRMPCGSSPLRCFFPAQAVDRDLMHLSADRQRKRRCSKPTHDLQVGSGAEHDASHHRCAASRRCFSPFPRTPTHNACGIFATKRASKTEVFDALCRVSTEKMPFAHHLLYRSEIFFLISGVITFLYCCAISQNWIFSSSVTSFFLHRVLNKVGFPPRKIYRRLSGI